MKEELQSKIYHYQEAAISNSIKTMIEPLSEIQIDEINQDNIYKKINEFFMEENYHLDSQPDQKSIVALGGQEGLRPYIITHYQSKEFYYRIKVLFSLLELVQRFYLLLILSTASQQDTIFALIYLLVAFYLIFRNSPTKDGIQTTIREG
jgi:hypothetical protein